MNAVDLQQVFQHIDGHCVLSGIDLQVPAGQVFLLLGPNGAGKTLMLQLLSGLRQPSSGRVSVLGESFSGRSRGELKALRRRIGVVFQGGSLIGDLSVLENILLPLRQDGLRRAEMERRSRLVMTRLHLDGLENAYPHSLSGGTLRQVELARALIHRPELLIWDEVLDGVDWDSAQEVLNLMRNERSYNDMTVILTGHRRSLLTSLADRIGIIDQGRLRFIGSLQQVREAAAGHRRLQTLLGDEQ